MQFPQLVSRSYYAFPKAKGGGNIPSIMELRHRRPSACCPVQVVAMEVSSARTSFMDRG